MKEGWEVKTLGELCDIVNGGTPKTGIEEYWGGQHQWITPAEMGKRSSPYVSNSERTLTDLGLQNCSARPLPPYSVILSSRAPIGHLVINAAPMATNQGCKGLVPDKTLDHKFLFYFLGKSVELLNDLGTGATFKELSGGKLKEVPIPLPPLPEQQRIVALLDDAFDGIATAKANAEQNLKNARELFESHLQAVFTQRGEGWERQRIENVCESIMDCVNKTAPKVDEPTPFKMIRTTNVRGGKVNLDSVYYVTEDTYNVWTRRQTPKSGDVILTREAPLGEVGMLLSDDKVFLGQRLVSYRADPTQLDNHFLLYAFQSEDLQGQIRALGSGATVQHMRVPDSKNLKLSLPHLREQQTIVAHLDALLATTQLLESIYKQKLAALDELKKSLLHKAFNGEL